MTKFHSRILDEIGEVSNDGFVKFNCGVEYTKPEIDVLKNIAPEDMKGIHLIKSVFGGELVYYGKTDVLPVHPVKLKSAVSPVVEQISLF